jgi:lipopolysaccharide assembly outer membrane protein LptD (OstA)
MLNILLFIGFCLLNAEEERSRFSADRYTRKSKEEKVILDGNVVVVKGTSVIKADKVELNTKNETYKAQGNVSYKDKDLEIKSTKIDGNLNSAQGTITDGKIISGKDIFQGAKIDRLSRQHFLIKEGTYTSCVNDPPDWRLYSNDIDMTTGEYAHLKDVVIESFGLPVVYLPYLVLPIKNERQSGFLPPSFGFGSDGFNIHEPFFWAISRGQDATFTLGHYGNRGRKEAVEFRSVYNSLESFTEMYYFHVNDKKFSSIIYKGQPLNEKNRHGFKMDQDFKLAESSYMKMRLRYVSDDNIPRDFAEEMEGRAEPALESKVMLLTHTDNFAYTADASYYEDLLSINPLDVNKMQLHRIPELTVNLAKTKYSIFMFEADASYLNIYRSGPYFDDINSNNIYDGTEFIRTGQRFDVFPRMSIPITTKALKITPSIGYRYDYYMLPVDGNANRNFADIRANVVSEISRVYQRGKDKQYRAIKHSIEPFVDYHVIPSVNQSKHAFFDNSNNNINAPMFDSIDSIGKTNTITYGITNRLLTKYVRNFVDPKRMDNPSQNYIKNDDNEDPSCKDCESKSCDTCKPDPSMNPESKMMGDTESFLGLRTSTKKSADSSGKQENIDGSDEDFSVFQPLQWRIRQSYNFLDTTGKPFGYLYSDILGNYDWISVLISNFYNFYTKKMGTSSYVRLSGSQKYIQLGYYNDKTQQNLNTDQIHLQFGFGVWRFFTNVRFIFNNSLTGKFSDKIQDKYFDVTYSPPSSCWFLKFAMSAPYDKPGFNVFITFNLLISGQAVGFGSEGNFMGALGTAGR